MNLLTRFYMAYITYRMRKNDNARLLEQMGNLPLHVTVKKDISYCQDQALEHSMDLIYPENMDQVMLPTIVNIHGGGFIYGYKELNQAYNMHLALQGFAVVSLNYRLVPQVNLLGQLEDIMCALHHLEDNLVQYPCNPKYLFLTGDSAGALLALYAYAANSNEKIAKAFGVRPTKFSIQALGFTSGLFFTRGTSIGDLLKRGKPYLFPKNYLKAAFYPYMNPERLLQACKLPPCYLQTSREDFIRDHTLEFEVMLTRRGVLHKLREWDPNPDHTLGHIFPVIHPEWEESRITMLEMLDFFREQFSEE